MRIPAVSLDVWHSLYHNSLRFKELEPWKTLYDSDYFGVRDPITGQIGYCSVMGALGQVFALCMHRGSAGLQISRRIQVREITADDFPGLPNCLMGEFEDRRALRNEDLAIIEDRRHIWDIIPT